MRRAPVSINHRSLTTHLFSQPHGPPHPFNPPNPPSLPLPHRKVLWSDVWGLPKHSLFFNRSWDSTDLAYLGFISSMHLLALAAPATFSWPMVGLFAVGYFITGVWVGGWGRGGVVCDCVSNVNRTRGSSRLHHPLSGLGLSCVLTSTLTHRRRCSAV